MLLAKIHAIGEDVRSYTNTRGVEIGNIELEVVKRKNNKLI